MHGVERVLRGEVQLCNTLACRALINTSGLMLRYAAAKSVTQWMGHIDYPPKFRRQCRSPLSRYNQVVAVVLPDCSWQKKVGFARNVDRLSIFCTCGGTEEPTQAVRTSLTPSHHNKVAKNLKKPFSKGAASANVKNATQLHSALRADPMEKG